MSLKRRGPVPSLSDVEGDSLNSDAERAILFSVDLRESHSTLFTRESASCFYKVDRGHPVPVDIGPPSSLFTNERTTLLALERPRSVYSLSKVEGDSLVSAEK